MKKYFYLLILLFATIRSTAQPDIQWTKALGGVGNDNATAIRQTNDGGYILSGFTSSKNGDVTGLHTTYPWRGSPEISNIGYLPPHPSDAWIVKLDMNSNMLWQKCLGGFQAEIAYDIQQTNDGGYIMCGITRDTSELGDVTGNHGGVDIWVVKLTGDGNIQWQKCFGGSSDEYAYSIQQTNDGGYIIAGSTFSNNGDVSGNHGAKDCWIIRLDNSGLLQWQQTLGGTRDDGASSVCQTSDGGFIIAGYTNSSNGNVTGHHSNTNNADYWIVKLNSTGTLQWQKCLGGTKNDGAAEITLTSDGGYCVAGYSYSNNNDVRGHHGNTGAADFWIVKLSNAGSIQWQKSLGGSNSDVASSIQQCSDGGYIVTGTTNSTNGDVTGFHGINDYWVVKLNTTGNMQWQKTLGGSQQDHGSSVRQSSDGGYVVAGWALSRDLDVTGSHGAADYWVVKFEAEGNARGKSMIENPVTEPGGTFKVYPNPATEKINFLLPGNMQLNGITISVFNALGIKLKEIKAESSIETLFLNEFKAGVYFYRIVNKMNVLAGGKFIVQ